jgi:5-methylcytosine-specific restriction endonuclease McrA
MKAKPRTGDGKVCTKCGRFKKYADFCISKKHVDGLASSCKDCHNKQTKKYANENRECINLLARKNYIKNREKESLRKKKTRLENPDVLRERGKRYRFNNHEKVLSYHKKYNAEHKAEIHQYYISNKSKSQEYAKKYRLEHLDIIKARFKSWFKQNREHKRQCDSAYGKKYRQEHPEKGREYDHRRRVRELNAPGSGFTDTEWQTLKSDYGYHCAYCNQKKPLTIEHVVPLDKGGAHEAENIVPACKSCNSGKRNKSLLFYMMHRLQYD